MCLAIPGKIKKIHPSIDEVFKMASVVFGLISKEVNLCMVPDAKEGDYVLVHVGVAISIIDEIEALKTLDYLQQLGELEEIEEDTPKKV